VFANIKAVPDRSMGLVNVVFVSNKCSLGRLRVQGVREMQGAQATVARDFRPRVFSWIDPKWTPDLRPKIFSNSVFKFAEIFDILKLFPGV
jgi:hypothetical protein